MSFFYEMAKKMHRSRVKPKIYGLFNQISDTSLWLQSTVRTLNNQPVIYSIESLSMLLAEPNHIVSEHEGKSYRVLRFLVKKDGTLVFGKEGGVYGDIPAHYQMASLDPWRATCLTAGNAYFDENNKLAILDNKSGDFRPPFDTLQFAVQACLKHQHILSNALMIREVDRDANIVNQYHLDLSIYIPHSILGFMCSLSEKNKSAAPVNNDEEEKAHPPENNEQIVYRPLIKPLIDTERNTIYLLKNYLNSEIIRLNELNFNVKGRDDKSRLFNLLFQKLSAIEEGQLAKGELQTIIRECAIIAHHKRRSITDKIASLTTFGIFFTESESWKQWKKLALAPNSLFSLVHQQTLMGKDGRGIQVGEEVISNYNDYRIKQR